jgi:hypothetical protein
VGLDFNWWKWFNPKTDSIISNYNKAYTNLEDYFCEPRVTSPIAECAYNSKKCLRYGNRNGCGIRPSVTISQYSYAYGRITSSFHVWLSPNGTPFLSYNQADTLFSDGNTIRFFTVQTQHRCDAAPPSCEHPCEYGAPTTLLWSWVLGDVESAVCSGQREKLSEFIYSGVVDELEDTGPRYDFTLKYKAITSRLGSDHTEDRDEFYEEHENWFDEDNHPKYDDRHEDYC